MILNLLNLVSTIERVFLFFSTIERVFLFLTKVKSGPNKEISAVCAISSQFSKKKIVEFCFQTENHHHHLTWRR